MTNILAILGDPAASHDVYFRQLALCTVTVINWLASQGSGLCLPLVLRYHMQTCTC